MTTTPSISKETMESVYTKVNEFLGSLSDEEREVVGMTLSKAIPENADVEGYNWPIYATVSSLAPAQSLMSWVWWCMAACPSGTDYGRCESEHWCVPYIG